MSEPPMVTMPMEATAVVPAVTFTSAWTTSLETLRLPRGPTMVLTRLGFRACIQLAQGIHR